MLNKHATSMKLVLENREKFLQEELGHLKTFHLKLKADLRASQYFLHSLRKHQGSMGCLWG